MARTRTTARLDGSEPAARVLWRALLAESRLPHLDRWLGRRLRPGCGLGARARERTLREIERAVRLGTLALFVETGGAASAAEARARAPEFAARFATAAAIVEGWRAIDEARYFALIDELGRGAHPVLRSLRSGDDLVLQLLALSIPPQFAAALTRRAAVSRWDATAVTRFLAGQNTAPPLWLRVNREADGVAVATTLRAEGYAVEVAGNALRVTGDRPIYQSEVYRSGRAEVQDIASQQSGAAVAARPGQRIWDACAGSGGKTMQIAAALDNRGALYSSDVDVVKLATLRQRARRAQFSNVRTLPWDGQALPEFAIEVTRQGGFDWVLVDAPCSASGTWRRNPDARVRCDADGISGLQQRQLQLLGSAAGAVRPGGHLVYATCSWLVDEDEDVVELFLSSHPDFEPVADGVHGWPAVDGDTFFTAVLKKK